MSGLGDLQLMDHSMQKPSHLFLQSLNTSVLSLLSPFLLFCPFTNEGKHKMVLLREQHVMSVCKIEAGKVSPPAQLPSDCSYQSHWTSISFSCIFCLHHQQRDETLGDTFFLSESGDDNSDPFWVAWLPL